MADRIRQTRVRAFADTLKRLSTHRGGTCPIIDLLSDLRRWCDACGYDFGELDRLAYRRYLHERAPIAVMAVRDKTAKSAKPSRRHA